MDITSIPFLIDAVSLSTNHLHGKEKTSGDEGGHSHGFIEMIDGALQDKDREFGNALLSIGRGSFSGIDFEFRALQRKNFINAVASLDGALIKSINRLEQING
jgi:hypothetical protein